MKKILLLFTVIALTGCASKKDVIYLQNVDDNSFDIDSLYKHPKIQANDILKIDITALEPESLIPYKFDKLSDGGRINNQIAILQLEGYLVGEDGTIDYPGLGKVEVKGKTTQEAQQFLEAKLSEYVKNVEVKIRLLNFKFSVLGEVKSPGTFNVTEERITLPQALAMAGDMTIFGKRSEVLILRNEGGNLESHRIDFTNSDWINSSYYFIKQNDVVYVEPNNTRVKQSGFVGNFGNVISVASILLSAAVIIFRR